MSKSERLCIVCGEQIAECMGFVLARDFIDNTPQPREVCGKCALAYDSDPTKVIDVTETDICERCGKWAGAHATLPGQPTDHLCFCSEKIELKQDDKDSEARIFSDVIVSWQKVREAIGKVETSQPTKMSESMGALLIARAEMDLAVRAFFEHAVSRQ